MVEGWTPLVYQTIVWFANKKLTYLRENGLHCILSGWYAMVAIRSAQSPRDYDVARTMFEEYAGLLGFDLDFQGFQEELQNLPRQYGEQEGILLLAEDRGEVVGCVGVRKWSGEVCEMKRLYVKPGRRGSGIGRMLAESLPVTPGPACSDFKAPAAATHGRPRRRRDYGS